MNKKARMFTRIVVILVLAAMIISFLPILRADEGEELAHEVKIRAWNAGGSLDRALDRNVMTQTWVIRDRLLTIESEEDFAGLYIMWHGAVPDWTMTVGEETLRGNPYGFMHEYVELPKPASHVEIQLEGEGEVLITELYAYSEGKLPDSVQRWEPPCDKADILIVSTHSDDEFIFFGGMIPYYAGELGLNVQMAYMVDHIKVYLERPHELLDSIWYAGVTHYPVIGKSSDWEVNNYYQAQQTYGEDNFKSFQVELLRRFKPAVVVTQDYDGEYGHPVHMLNARCLTESVLLANDPSAYPESAEKYGLWDTPKTYLHLWGDDPTMLDYETPLAHFGGLTGFEAAQQAYKLCVSQYKDGYFEIYPLGHKWDSHRFGLYRSTVGEDVMKCDLLENLSEFDY